MSTQEILMEKKDHIAFITLNRPDHKNTFTVEFANALNDALEDFDMDDDVRVVIIQAAGKHFSTGIDLSLFDEKSPNEYKEFISLMDKHNHTVANMKKPVIAAVKGYCLANGAGLAFAADLSVVAESAKIGTTAINVGLICTGPAIPLMRIIGKKKAMEMVLLGEMISGQEAFEMGLMNKVVKDEELEAAALEMAQKIVAKSPLAVRAGKQGINGTANMSYHPSVDYGSEVFAALCSSGDAKEGVRAFLEKRAPVWQLK